MRRAPLRGPITKRSAAFWIARLLFLEAADKRVPILIELDSPGGSLPDSLQAIRVLEKLACPVAIFCRGTIGGTALSIAAHGSKGCRAAAPGTRFVFSAMQSAPASGPPAGDEGTPADLINGLAKASGRQVSEVAQWLGSGAEFDAQQAAERGLIDAVSAKPLFPAK